MSAGRNRRYGGSSQSRLKETTKVYRKIRRLSWSFFYRLWKLSIKAEKAERLYSEFATHPLSETSESLLHTGYAPRVKTFPMGV
ncbi:iron hydrogenase small subunit [Thermodesulfitimonas sp.]